MYTLITDYGHYVLLFLICSNGYNYYRDKNREVLGAHIYEIKIKLFLKRY